MKNFIYRKKWVKEKKEGKCIGNIYFFLGKKLKPMGFKRKMKKSRLHS